MKKPELEQREVEPVSCDEDVPAFESIICMLELTDDEIRLNAHALRDASPYFDLLFSMSDEAVLDLSEEPEELQAGLVTVLGLLDGEALEALDDETLQAAIEAAEKYQFHSILERIEGHLSGRITEVPWEEKVAILQLMPDSRVLRQRAARIYESLEDATVKALIQSEREHPNLAKCLVLKEEVLRRVTAETGPGWFKWINSLRDGKLRKAVDSLDPGTNLKVYFEAIAAFNDTHYQDLREPIARKMVQTVQQLTTAKAFKAVWDIAEAADDQPLKEDALQYVATVDHRAVHQGLPHLWDGEIPAEIYASWRTNPDRSL